MAPSSLVGGAGFGMFTTRDMEANEKILGGPDGISIPVVSYYQYRRKNAPNAAQHKAWIKLWNNWWWSRGVPDHVMYEAVSENDWLLRSYVI
jgi:hypothetical protein